MANKYDIFISYSRKDSDKVNAIVNYIEKAGFHVWIDKNGIESGEGFKHVIVNAIENSSVVLFFSSENSHHSPWTAKEVGVAVSLKKHIIPIHLDSSNYNKEIMFDLVNIDFIDYTDPSKHEAVLQKLIKSLEKHCSIDADVKISRDFSFHETVSHKGNSRNNRNIFIVAITLIAIILIGIGYYVFKNDTDMSIAEIEDIERRIDVQIENSQFTMYYVKPGTFWMGAQSNDAKCRNYNEEAAEEEGNVHKVTLDGFYMSETEVTQAQWIAVMGNNNLPEWSQEIGLGDNYPAYGVSFTDAQVFTAKLSAITGRKFRLPTEAEWEWAARGAHDKCYTYSGSNNIDLVANYDNEDNAPKTLKEVKMKQPNELKLYDMSGNLWEWCSDYWEDTYKSDSIKNPQGPSMGEEHVNRGGAFESLARRCRVTTRRSRPTNYTSKHLGFRVVMTK